MSELKTDAPLPNDFVCSLLVDIPDLRFKYASTDVSTAQTRLTLSYCDDLLEKLIKDSKLLEFRTKIDPNSPRFADYMELVKHPMDLTTLQERLRHGVIQSVEQFKEELDLIWKNCKLFYGPNHRNSITAAEYSRMIDDEWEILERPDFQGCIDSLKVFDEVLTACQPMIPLFIPIPPRPAIPPPPQLSVAKKQKEKVVPPAETPPNLMQRNQIAEILNRTDYKQLPEAWAALKPCLTDQYLEDGKLAINKLPKGILIKLKQLLLT